jgi:hypothetical protein
MLRAYVFWAKRTYSLGEMLILLVQDVVTVVVLTQSQIVISFLS